MNRIKVNLTSQYFNISQHIEIMEEMLANLIQKHSHILLDETTNQVIICQCDEKATTLDSNGVEAPHTIEDLYFYAFFTQHIAPKDPSLSLVADIMVDYLEIKCTGAAPIRINKIGENEYNATDCPGCNCSTEKTKH